MISLISALDGTVTIWRRDGTDYRLPVARFRDGRFHQRAGPRRRAALDPPARGRAACARTVVPQARAFRRWVDPVVVVIGRRDTPATEDVSPLSITAATDRPHVFAFDGVPDAGTLRAAHATIPDDAWTRRPARRPRLATRAMTLMLAEQVRAELVTIRVNGTELTRRSRGRASACAPSCASTVTSR